MEPASLAFFSYQEGEGLCLWSTHSICRQIQVGVLQGLRITGEGAPWVPRPPVCGH